MPDKTRTLVIVAHPDDEVLGCGATLARWASEGDEVQVTIATDGAAGRGATDSQTLARGMESARQAAAILGTLPPISMGFPDQRLDTIPLLEITRRVERIGHDFQPHRVVTHCQSDLNKDHRVLAEAAATAFRPNGLCPCTLFLRCETPSTTEIGGLHLASQFMPQYFVEVTDYVALKRTALECYSGEMRGVPHMRSYEAVEALSRIRGATCGVPFAEAFEVSFWIQGRSR